MLLQSRRPIRMRPTKNTDDSCVILACLPLLGARTVLKVVFVGFLMTLLSACSSDEMSDLKAYVAEIKNKTGAPIEPLPKMRVIEPFVFRPNASHDPFEPDDILRKPVDIRVETGIKPDMSRPREELESAEMDSLRMVGNLKQGGSVWALVRASDGLVHRVRVGNYLGTHHGRIVNIVDDRIELIELVADSLGIWHERVAAISMTETGVKKP